MFPTLGPADGNRGNALVEHDTTLAAFKESLGRLRLLNHPPDSLPPNTLFGIGDDATLQRFLSARNEVLGDAVEHFQEASTFRSTNQLGTLYDDVDLGIFEAARNLYPHWNGRVCKKGRPIYVFDTKKLNDATIRDFKKTCDALRKPTNYQQDGRDDSQLTLRPENLHNPPTVDTLYSMLPFEHLIRFVLPLCSMLRPLETPITNIIMLVDISGMGLRKIWSLKDYLQNLSSILALNYPEVLNKVFIINAPKSFSTIWNIIRSWADPLTASKISFLAKNQVQETMYAYIADADLPSEYGGSLQYKYGMQPMLDDRIMKCLNDVEGWEGNSLEGPLKWIEGEDSGVFDVVAVGTQNRERRNLTVGRLRIGNLGDKLDQSMQRT